MATLDHYRECVREADARKAALDEKVKSLSQKPRWKPSCDALKCLKGIDAVTAVSIACEADGFSRFATASGFAAWVGLVPSEHSSGESQCRGGITKAGNKHLRRLLVEVAEGPGRGSIGRRGDQTPRQRRREAPGRQASRLGRGRQAEQRGQRRGRARAGVLVLGRWPHGGRRLARAARITGSLPAFPGSTGVGPHPRIFFVRRRSRHARSKTDEPEGPAVATRCTGAFCAMGEY